MRASCSLVCPRAIVPAAHPSTAAALDKSNERIRALQVQLGQVYEQIRGEQATQLQLRAQIESRTGHAHRIAASDRAETMLETALKSARTSIIASAAAYDGVAGGGFELAEGERPGVSGMLLTDG